MNTITWLTFIAITAGVVGYVYYWLGVAHGERGAQQRESVLLNDLDLAIELIAQQGRQLTEAAEAAPRLRVVK
jgi:hypothetical protein